MRVKKNKLRRKFEGEMGWIATKLLVFIVSKLPKGLRSSFGGKIGRLTPFFLRKRSMVVRNNLKIAFGKTKNEEEIKKIYRSFFQEVGKELFELLSLLGASKEKIKDAVTIEGKKNLDDALKNGKGVIGLSAHFGCFPLLCFRLVAEGYPFSVVARHPRNKKLSDFFLAVRDRMGVGFFPDKPMRDCVRNTLSCLRKNEILFLQIDLNVSSKGGKVYVDFFGKSVPTPTAPVSLSIKTGSPILPMFIVKDSDGRHKIIIDKPVILKSSGIKGDDIYFNTAKLSKIIEAYIIKYPTHWWWLHKRWRKAR